MRARLIQLKVRGFTLVEILVATAVLALLVMMAAQLTNSATLASMNSRKHMDADSQARLIFDRMGNDFARMLKRKDVDYVFDKRAGNDSCFFFSESTAYSSGTVNPSSISLIGYRINAGLKLERLGKALSWDGAAGGQTAGAPVFLTYPPAASASASPTPYPASTISGNWPGVVGESSADPDFHVIGEQVYRMEFCYLLNNGTLSNTPYIPPHTAINGFRDVAAIVVSIAILDSASQQIVKSNDNMVSSLGDPTDAEFGGSPPRTMLQTWLAAVNAPNFAQLSGIPRSAASQVRIYQRYFYINK